MNIEMAVDPIRAGRAILGFTGWGDAGKTIQHTVGELIKGLACRKAATWDLDGFWHSDSSRPLIEIRHGLIQRLEWPSYDFFLSSKAAIDPVLLGMGPEPGYQWRLFTDQILGLLKSWGCEEIILLGSLYDQIYHDEILLSAVVHDTRSFNKVRELGLGQIEYTGPTAIHAAIMQMAKPLDISCVSIWAHLPFYLTGLHELVMAHLLRSLGTWLDVELPTEHLFERWKVREKEIEELVQQDPELRRMVETMKSEERLPRIVDLSPKVVHLDEFVRRRNRHPADDDPST